jgi:glycosyltransferase involved in cell wall biosynthesis
MKPPAGPLRILVIVSLPWDSRLGASRVWIELAKEWTRAGHTVEKFCLTDAYPKPAGSRAGSALRQARFPWRAAAHVRRNADRFDVIDCLIGVLPFKKSSLRFHGLLVARSVGLYRLYDQFLWQSQILWPDQPKGRWFGRLFHRLLDWRSWKDSEKSVRHCDLLNLPSEDERLELARDPELRVPAVVQPYGLSEEFRGSLAKAAGPSAQRLHRKRVCFIGMWSLRKGSRDWPKIMAAIRQHHPAVEFLFLGTMFDEAVVRSELGSDESQRIFCQPFFKESDLPLLLADCAVALFPSYVEGFGLAVLEQLAAGLPTIAYDVPGPRQILHSQRARLLTPMGDTATLAARASEILALSVSDYERLSAECSAIARGYRWSEIASNTIDQYRDALNSLGRFSAESLRE